MADESPLFRTLKDSSNVAHAIDKMIEGDSPSAKNGIIAFGFKNSAGNVVLPQLTAGGAIMVDANASAGDPIHARGENAGSLTDIDVATITLTADKVYSDIEAIGSCLRETLFQLVQDNNGSETVIGDFLVGAGQFSFQWMMDCVQITAGSTGTQELILRAKNLDKVSTIRGAVCAFENV